MANTPVTVLTVDDQPVFRRAVGDLIAATPGFVEVGQAATGSEALLMAETLHPDLVLLDVRMEGIDGIETAQRLLVSDPDAVVVLISMNDLPDTASALAARPSIFASRTSRRAPSAALGRPRASD